MQKNTKLPFLRKKILKKVYLTFVLGTSCCYDNYCIQTTKATEIDISNYDIQENFKTKLQSEKCYT